MTYSMELRSWRFFGGSIDTIRYLCDFILKFVSLQHVINFKMIFRAIYKISVAGNTQLARAFKKVLKINFFAKAVLAKGPKLF